MKHDRILEPRLRVHTDTLYHVTADVVTADGISEAAIRFQPTIADAQREYLWMRVRLRAHGKAVQDIGVGYLRDDRRRLLGHIDKSGTLWKPNNFGRKVKLADPPKAGWRLTCATCHRFSRATSPDRDSGLCLSADSPDRGGFVTAKHGCLEWEGRKK